MDETGCAVHDVCDLLVVGAGPAGLYAAYYAGFRGLSVVVMDSLPEPGGQVAALYPEKPIYDVAGFPVVRGQELVDLLVQQAQQYDPTYLLGHRAQSLETEGDRVHVHSHRGHRVDAGAVLITGGIGTFTPRPLPDGTDYEGRGLRYFVPRPEELTGRDVLIVGGGDSAFDWALALESTAASVTLVHRRERFRAHHGSVARVLGSSVRVLVPFEVASIRGSSSIEAVEVFDNRDPTQRLVLPVHEVVAALGFTADLGVLAQWGLRQRKRKILVDSAMRTSLGRVFAAGDIVDYEGKVKLISVGFGEAATAVNNAAVLLHPDAHLAPGHSSDLPR